MDYVKKVLWGPDPKDQRRKIQAILRKNIRSIDKSIRDLYMLQVKTQNLIKKAAKKNEIKYIKLYATELYEINNQYSRMCTSKAQLQSIGMKIDDAFRLKSLSNQMNDTTALMKEVNVLVKLPQLERTMLELEKELMKAGIIEEMIDDTLEPLGDMERMDGIDEQADLEVNKIVEQYTNDQFRNVEKVPTEIEPVDDSIGVYNKEKEKEDTDREADKMLGEMQDKLRALQN